MISIALNVAAKEVDVDDDHAEPILSQDRLKDQGKELVEINLAGEGEED